MAGKLTDVQLQIAIGILRAGKCSLSKESPSDYVQAAGFIFDKGLLFYPGVALLDLEEELAGRTALEDKP